MPKVHVLLYTATVIEADFENDQVTQEEVVTAIHQGMAQIDPEKLNWVIGKISDKPIDIEMGDDYTSPDNEEAPKTSSLILPPH